MTSIIATVVAMTTPGFDPDLDLPRDDHPVGTRIYDREGNPIAIVISEFSKGDKASD